MQQCTYGIYSLDLSMIPSLSLAPYSPFFSICENKVRQTDRHTHRGSPRIACMRGVSRAISEENLSLHPPPFYPLHQIVTFSFTVIAYFFLSLIFLTLESSDLMFLCLSFHGVLFLLFCLFVVVVFLLGQDSCLRHSN